MIERRQRIAHDGLTFTVPVNKKLETWYSDKQGVRVPDALVGDQLEIFPAEGVAVARGKIRERHLVGAAHPGIQVVNLAGEAVRRQPFDHGVGIEEGAVDSLRRRTKHTVKPHCVRGHDDQSFPC